MELFIDTETSDKIPEGCLPKDPGFPWMVQLGCILSDENIKYAEVNLLISPEGRTISQGAYNAHGISIEMAESFGVDERIATSLLMELVSSAHIIVCHNIWFDMSIVGGSLIRCQDAKSLEELSNTPKYCTMIEGADVCKILRPGWSNYKWPTLQELHKKLFGERFTGAHDAMNDVRATRRCYYKMIEEEANDNRKSSYKLQHE